MASLKKIERMVQHLDERGLPTEPTWIRGYERRDNHLSGALREAGYSIGPGHDEGNFDHIVALLEEAAEALDDAHEEWLVMQYPDAFKGWNI